MRCCKISVSDVPKLRQHRTSMYRIAQSVGKWRLDALDPWSHGYERVRARARLDAIHGCAAKFMRCGARFDECRFMCGHNGPEPASRQCVRVYRVLTVSHHDSTRQYLGSRSWGTNHAIIQATVYAAACNACSCHPLNAHVRPYDAKPPVHAVLPSRPVRHFTCKTCRSLGTFSF